MRAGRAWLAMSVVAVGLFFLPEMGGRFWQYIVANVLLLGVFALSFNLLFGMTGYLSFGHAASYATGAYITALLLLKTSLSMLPALVVGILAAGVLAGLVGFFCVRHTQVYFSMLTLAFGMMVYALVWKWSSVTGGDDGLVGIPRGALSIPWLFQVSLTRLDRYYRFVVLVSLAAFYILYRISRSPFGLLMNGMRENAARLEFAGIPVRRYLWVVFVLSGLFAGVAGALTGPLENTVAPPMAHWMKSAEPILATLIGGPFTFAGPIVGAVIFIGLKELIVRYTSHWLLVFGLLLLGLVLGLRGGVVGFARERWLR